MSDRHALLIVEGCTFEGIEEIKADNTRSRFASNELLRKACRVTSRGDCAEIPYVKIDGQSIKIGIRIRKRRINY